MIRPLLLALTLALLGTTAIAAVPSSTAPLPIMRPHIYTASKPIHPEYPQNFETTYGYYKSTVLWPVKTIDVCWNVNDSFYNKYIFDEAVVQAAVTQTWSHFSPIRFTDWKQCPSGKTVGPDSLGIFVQDVNPGSYGLGTEINQNPKAVVFDFTYQTWDANDIDGTPCKNDATHRLHCDALIAVHEFGHLLGLSHEQNRPDTPRTNPQGAVICTADPQGENGDTTIGAWDLDSIMNYCNPEWNGDGNLSEGDVATIEHMYGDPFPAPPSAHVQTGSSEIMQSSYGTGSTGELDMALTTGSSVEQVTSAGGSWTNGPLIATGTSGIPQMLQTDYGIGVHPNFELLVRQGSQLMEYWRNNLDPALPWQYGGMVGIGATAGYAMTLGPTGNLEAYYSQSGYLSHLERVAAPGGFVWNRMASPVGSGVNDVAVTRTASGGYAMVVNQGTTLEELTSTDGMTWQNNGVVTTGYTYGGLGMQTLPSGALAVVAGINGGTYLFTLDSGSSSSSSTGHTVTTCKKATAAPSVPGQSSTQVPGGLPPTLGGSNPDCTTTYVPNPLPTSTSHVHLIGGGSAAPSWRKRALVSNQTLTSLGLAVSNISGGRLDVVGSLAGSGFVHFTHPANESAAPFVQRETIQ